MIQPKNDLFDHPRTVNAICRQRDTVKILISSHFVHTDRQTDTLKSHRILISSLIACSISTILSVFSKHRLPRQADGLIPVKICLFGLPVILLNNLHTLLSDLEHNSHSISLELSHFPGLHPVVLFVESRRLRCRM